MLLQGFHTLLTEKAAKINKIRDGFIRELGILADVIHPGQRHRELLVALDESSDLRVTEAMNLFILLFLFGRSLSVNSIIFALIRSFSLSLHFVLFIFPS